MIENQLKIKPKKITIDILGGMISRLEDRINARFNAVDVRFDELEKKMNFKFLGVSNQIDAIYLNYTNRREHELLQARVRKIERKVGIPAR